EELAADEVPRLALADRVAPLQALAGAVVAVLTDIGEFFLRDFLVVVRPAEQPDPQAEDDEAEQAGDQESHLPAVSRGHHDPDDRGHQHADVGAGVEDADAERALAAREPLGHGLDRAGIGSAFGDAERNAHEDELQHRAGRCVKHRGEAPQGNRDGHALARADAVEPAADHQQADAVAGLERGDDVAVIDFAPAHVLFDDRLEDAEDLAIDVVDRDDEEEQRADRPAVTPAGLEDRGGSGRGVHAMVNSACLSTAELLPTETTTGPGSTTSSMSRFQIARWRSSSVKLTVLRSPGARVKRSKPLSEMVGCVTERCGKPI